MSIRLKITSFWLPDFILKKELDKVALLTIAGLDNLLKQYAPLKMQEISNKDNKFRGSLEERRTSMAIAHNKRVKALIEALGYDNAVKVARKSMFDVGYQLGQEARRKLGVGNDFEDIELLRNYIIANNLLLECLQIAMVSDRGNILNSLLQ
jgi:hypothetical protein